MLGRVSDIDLRLLRVFAAVVESGGFSLATARLNIAESTISGHMSDLEARLGIRLCERGRSGFRLTRQGERVYAATLDLLGQLDHYRDSVAEIATSVGSTLRVGLPDASISNAAIPVATLFGDLAQALPSMRVELNQAHPRELERMVFEDHVHVAIGPEHRRISGLEYIALRPEPNSLYCGVAHPFFERPDDQIPDEAFAEERLIGRAYIDNFDAAFFGEARHAATANQIEAAAILIESGQYLGFLPDHFAKTFVDAGRMRAVRRDRFHFDAPFAIFLKKANLTDPRVARFVEIARRLGSGEGGPANHNRAAG